MEIAMDITDTMLQAAVRKAVEAGLLPRRACREDAKESRELMRLVVQAALGALHDEPHQAVPALGSPARSGQLASST